MRRTNTLQVIVILFLTISCADRNLEEQEKEASHPQAIEIQGSEQPKLSPAGGETKNYVPGEILVKFRDGTTDQMKEAIQKEKSSAESVSERLRNYEDVQYSEPNYIRTIN
jgi:hypothetical protein